MKHLMVFFLFCICVCSLKAQEIAPLPEKVHQKLKTYEQIDQLHQIQLTDSSEPGTPMLLMVEVYAKECACPLKGVDVFMTQTNDKGVYDLERDGDWTSARIRGTVKTDSEGRFLMHSIVPGSYPTSRMANPHIHTMIEEGNPPYYDIMFEPLINFAGRRNIARKPDQNFVAKMWVSEEGLWVGYVRIYVKQP